MVRRAATPVVLGTVLAVAAGGAVAQARRLPVYRSPGYPGVHKVPPLRPAQPLTPIDLSTNGKLPQALVDAAGTAHIVWTEPGNGGPDVTRYCRLRRGAKTCDNPPGSQRLVPAQPGDPQFNNEYYPRVLAVGNDVAIISYRYPNVTTKPDGTASSNSTYMWLSTDGGNSFGDPVLVGDQDPSGDAVVFGAPDSPQIGLISDTQTGGTFFQALAPGTYTGSNANLDEGDGNRAYGGSLAPVGTGLLAAFADANGNAYVRSYSGAGDPNDPESWTPSPPPFTGSDLRLASGPSGAFLLSRAGLLGSAPLEVRRMSGTQAGPPTRISDTSDAGSHAFTEDPAGELFAAWASSQRPDIRLRTSADGGRWSADELLAAGGHSLSQVDLATTSDGGGFATFVRDGGALSPGQVQAVPFGNQGPTGKLGLGSLPGGSTDPSVLESCQRISFGIVSVTTQQGCFLTAANGSGVRVSQGPIRINGVDVIPDPGTRILINARARAIDTVGPVSVQLKPIGDTSVEIFHGEVHTKVGPGGTRASAADAPSQHGTVLFSFDTKTFPVNLKGFPVQGSISVELIPGGTRIPISLELPKVFGGVTGEAELQTSEKDGLQLTSLKIQADTIPIGPLVIKDLDIEYQGGSEDTWTGGAVLILPPPGLGARLGAKVSFKAGKFKEGTLIAGPPYPGISIAPDTFLTQIGGGFGVDPLTLLLTAKIGAIPLDPPNYTFDVTGTAKVSFGNPVTFEFDGDGDLRGVKLDTAHGLVNTDGYLHVNGEAHFDVADVISVHGQLDAFVDVPTKHFGGRVEGKVCVAGVCTVGGDAVLSSNGIGACVTAVASYGFGYHWGDPLTKIDLMFPTCDLSPYTIAPPGQAGTAQAGRFTVRSGTSLETLRLIGSGGPPDVTLVSPQGQRITPVAAPGTASAPAASLAVPSQSATYVGLRRPAAGSWTIEPNPGSPPVSQVAVATGQPAPSVHGRVSGHGRKRTLVYRLGGGSNLSATFYEIGREGTRVIGRSTGRQGRLSFVPAYGPGGRRTIAAAVERNGTPRLRVTVTSYTAPAPPRPGRVPGLRVVRSRSTLHVRWRSASGASQYLVRVNLSDGRHLARLLRSAVRSLAVPGVSKPIRDSVSVRALDSHGHGGPLSKLRS